ncbi:MAG: 16S rRNA (cytidine(1402)-2'-O)-methyltransferase [Thermodesulfobacteriota bacterium]
MSQEKRTSPGTLYIVATPIGNLEDITLRGLRILKEVDLIAAEDTRHSKKLLNHYGIKTSLISYYREKEQQRASQLLEKLHGGQDIALISDAGTPGISDPGAILVGRALDESIRVVPIPGPSALTTALSASGLTESSFCFLGFAPQKKSKRRKLLDSLVDASLPLVFYESPHRIHHLLGDIHEILGNRDLFIGRELTKTHEELKRGTAAELLEQSLAGRNRGEFVVMIKPGIKVKKNSAEDLDQSLLDYSDDGELSTKDIIAKVSRELGLPRSQVYKRALEIL